MKTVVDVLKLATEFLSKKGIKKPRFVADVLLSHYLNVERIEMYLQYDRPLLESELSDFRQGVIRAGRHEPIDYILGEVEFLGCRIKVGPGVLVPRPETEILVDHIGSQIGDQKKKVLDLCTGSGCIAAALKTRLPQLEVYGVDLSPKALEIAKINHQEVTWLEGDLIQPVKKNLFDVVVCNPPYVSEGEYRKLDLGIRQFEPKMALVGGESGLEFYKRLSSELPLVLNIGAKIFFEIGCNQGEDIKKLFSSNLWGNQKVLPDWSGHDRFFEASFR